MAMQPPPFTLPASTKVALDVVLADGMTAQDVERQAHDLALSVAAMGPDYVLLRDPSRAYVRVTITPIGLVAGRLVIEGDDAAELDQRLWFTFRGLRDRAQAALTIGAPARQVIAALRALAPIGLEHVTTAYRADLGSLRMYHLVGGGVIALEVDPSGTVTAAQLLAPKIGQGTVLAIAAQDADSTLAWDQPHVVPGLRAALDDVLGRKADIVGVRELDDAGDTIEVTGRNDDGTRRFRYDLRGRGKVATA
jgi:hypothetical protein